jgi:hypothetical protein
VAQNVVSLFPSLFLFLSYEFFFHNFDDYDDGSYEEFPCLLLLLLRCCSTVVQ